MPASRRDRKARYAEPHRWQVQIGPGSAAFPVADGVEGHADLRGQGFLLHPQLFPEKLDAAANHGGQGFFQRLSAVQIDYDASRHSRRLYLAACHVHDLLCLQTEIKYDLRKP